MKDAFVISLGGSRIVPYKVDEKFLKDFKKIINSHKSKKFIIVTGGGSTARTYMKPLKNMKKSHEIVSDQGVSTTRYHARFMTRIFGENSNDNLPKNMKDVKNLLQKNQVVFCGALRNRKNQTTDSTAAKLASYLKCPFINITDVKGLYTSNPKKNKSAKFIPEISFNEFNKIASKIKFKQGQHFVLDQKAAKQIKKDKTPTYIIGSLASLDKALNNKKFIGTIIS
jgi:uridylate kinase